jgi:short-subunit dehydrogenase
VIINTVNLAMRTLQSFFLETLKPEFNYRQFMDINYYGCVYPTIAALPHLDKTAGRICVVSSIGGLAPFVRQTFYNASKYALVGFFESLRLELMSKESGVSITLVCPGYVKTSITEGGGLGRDGKPVGASIGISQPCIILLSYINRILRINLGVSAKSLGIPMISPEVCAEQAIVGAINRERLVVAPTWYRLFLALRALAPAFVDRMLVKNFAPNRKRKN